MTAVVSLYTTIESPHSTFLSFQFMITSDSHFLYRSVNGAAETVIRARILAVSSRYKEAELFICFQ